ncbi:MAG: NAD(P)-dependent oxidoreductase [Ignavibacteria bacterium]|nr:NAD(P)-dependent oxidoreductase [Ignavibacteria bacterium]
MRYLITGGAGFLGINLARYLLAKGEEVTSLDLLPFDYPDVLEDVREVQGDIRDPAAVRSAVQGADIVVHAAAALPLYSDEDIVTTDVQGTRNVLSEAMKAGVGRVVHISSTAVYGIPDHHPLLESDRLEGVGAYGKAKIDAELVCNEFRLKGHCVPILRPKTFIGPERLGVFALLYDWALEGRGFPMIGSGNNRYQLLDVEDLCDAIYLAAAGEPHLVNDTFNIGAKVFGTMKTDYQAVLDEAGFGKRIRPFPAGPVILGLKVLEKLGLSPLYQWVYETASTDSFVSIERAEKILGFSPRYSNEEALIRNFRWYRENLDRFKEASGVTHRVPWKQGVLSLVRYFF